MEFVPALLTLAVVQLLAVISPGQSFLVVTRVALGSGRGSGIATAAGMGLGSVLWALAAIAGLAVVLEQAAWLYGLLKLAGGSYLCYLALQLWRHASEEIAPSESSEQQTLSHGAAFLLGLSTQLANPKVVVFFGSIFFALLPEDSSTWVFAASLLIVAVNETGWYTLVSLLFSHRSARRRYGAIKPWLDRVMGSALGLIGASLIRDSRESFS